jgi:hypothetical protein
VAATSCVALIIIAVIVVRSNFGNKGAATEEGSKPVARQSESPLPPTQAMDLKTITTPSPDKPPAIPGQPVTDPGATPPLVPTIPPDVVSPQSPPATESGKVTAQQPVEPAPETFVEAPKPQAEEPVKVAVDGPQQPARIPVPDSNARAEAMKQVQEIYGREIAAAKTVEQKKAFAEKILNSARAEEKDRKSQFILLQLSRDIAAQAGDSEIALQAIQELGKVFQFDALAAYEETLRKTAALALTIEQHTNVAKKAASAADEAVAADNFPIALQINAIALAEARKAKDDALITGSSERRAEIEAISHSFEETRPAIATLEKTPTDPAANSALGKYKCFMKGDWEHGLPFCTLGQKANNWCSMKKALPSC